MPASTNNKFIWLSKRFTKFVSPKVHALAGQNFELIFILKIIIKISPH